jgi:hypothetical protein
LLESEIRHGASWKLKGTSQIVVHMHKSQNMTEYGVSVGSVIHVPCQILLCCTQTTWQQREEFMPLTRIKPMTSQILGDCLRKYTKKTYIKKFNC